MRFILYTVVLFLGVMGFSQSSYAEGNEGGNGGDVMICQSEAGELSVHLLDYFRVSGIEMEVGADAFEKTREVLLDLRRIDPVRATLYLQGLDNFIEEAVFHNGRLRNIEDEGRLPRGTSWRGFACVPRQVAIQYRLSPHESYSSWSKVEKGRYLIDQIMWDMMSEEHRAGLILHELIYREAINLMPRLTKNSILVRSLNRIWVTRRNTLSQREYNVYLRYFRFPVLRDL